MEGWSKRMRGWWSDERQTHNLSLSFKLLHMLELRLCYYSHLNKLLLAKQFKHKLLHWFCWSFIPFSSVKFSHHRHFGGSVAASNLYWLKTRNSFWCGDNGILWWLFCVCAKKKNRNRINHWLRPPSFKKLKRWIEDIGHLVAALWVWRNTFHEMCSLTTETIFNRPGPVFTSACVCMCVSVVMKIHFMLMNFPSTAATLKSDAPPGGHWRALWVWAAAYWSLTSSFCREALTQLWANCSWEARCGLLKLDNPVLQLNLKSF